MNETLEEPGIDTGRHHLSELWGNRQPTSPPSPRKTKSGYRSYARLQDMAGRQHCIISALYGSFVVSIRGGQGMRSIEFGVRDINCQKCFRDRDSSQLNALPQHSRSD